MHSHCNGFSSFFKFCVIQLRSFNFMNENLILLCILEEHRKVLAALFHLFNLQSLYNRSEEHNVLWLFIYLREHRMSEACLRVLIYAIYGSALQLFLQTVLLVVNDWSAYSDVTRRTELERREAQCQQIATELFARSISGRPWSL